MLNRHSSTGIPPVDMQNRFGQAKQYTKIHIVQRRIQHLTSMPTLRLHKGQRASSKIRALSRVIDGKKRQYISRKRRDDSRYLLRSGHPSLHVLETGSGRKSETFDLNILISPHSCIWCSFVPMKNAYFSSGYEFSLTSVLHLRVFPIFHKQENRKLATIGPSQFYTGVFVFDVLTACRSWDNPMPTCTCCLQEDECSQSIRLCV